MPEVDVSVISAIGELKNFAAQQISTNDRLLVANDRMIDELRRLSDVVSDSSKLSATFMEYRNVLHERFDKIHHFETEIDERVEKLDLRTDVIERTMLEWRTMLRTASIATFTVSAIVGALLAQVVPLILKIVFKV
jgi:hypothetical protein